MNDAQRKALKKVLVKWRENRVNEFKYTRYFHVLPEPEVKICTPETLF